MLPGRWRVRFIRPHVQLVVDALAVEQLAQELVVSQDTLFAPTVSVIFSRRRLVR